MNLTSTRVRKKSSPFKSDAGLPYHLYLDGYGPIGDKFNCNKTSTGIEFPAGAAGRFATRAEAEAVLHKFLTYVRAKIKDASKKKRGSEDEKIDNSKRHPSYYLWS